MILFWNKGPFNEIQKGNTMEKEVLRGINEVASYLEISKITVKRLIKKGLFPVPLEEKGSSKLRRTWPRKDLERVRKSLRKPGQRIADQQVNALKQRNTELEQRLAEVEKKIIPQYEERIKELQQTIASQAEQIKKQAEQIKALTASKKAKANKPGKHEPRQADFDALREKLKQEADKRGGNNALAKWIGVNESIIRRFLKGEHKTLTPENQRKVEKALQGG
jgi:uncharacterized coiled-coil protein SlyX/predicted DNA-binding transcriptional regulator AlpA